MRDDATLTEVVPPYQAPAWLVGGHAQTIWPYLLRRPAVTLRRERVGHDATLYAIGVSLGGSTLLNWLGRAGRDAAKIITAAAAISAPIDLTAAGIAIGQGANRIYTNVFLRTLKPKALAMAAIFP